MFAALPFTATFEMISSEVAPTHSHTMLYQFAVVWGLPVFIFLIYIAQLLLERRKMKVPDLAVLLMGLCAFGLIIMPELIYVKDIYGGEHYRANTMFKLTYQAFILFGMMMGYVTVRTLRLKAGVLRGLALAGGFVLLVTGGYTVNAVRSWFGNVFDPAARISSDASVFVDEYYESDYGAVNWLNKNVSGQPVVLEAPGDSYSDYERVSVATGLPTVLGWYVHEWLWRNDVAELNQRTADIETIYTTGDAETARRLIAQYNITYIYIGKLEREKYPALNDRLLQTLGEVAYSDGVSTYIMKVG
jgi:YYY domain-containing protein